MAVFGEKVLGYPLKTESRKKDVEAKAIQGSTWVTRRALQLLSETPPYCDWGETGAGPGKTDGRGAVELQAY
eukprot:5379179-Amphidinium_carterae.1